jgi:hypothetical protein
VGNEYLKELIYGSSFTTSKLISNMEETPSWEAYSCSASQ